LNKHTKASTPRISEPICSTLYNAQFIYFASRSISRAISHVYNKYIILLVLEIKLVHTQVRYALLDRSQQFGRGLGDPDPGLDHGGPRWE
jgi:hypothetical protein